MATAPNVLGLFGLPNRKSSLIAIANAVRDIEYKERLTLAEIAAELDVDTVENAKAANNLLSFHTVARMLALWPQHCSEIRNLWEMQPVEVPTIEDRLDSIEREAAAIRRAVA